ncbi:hypothetical protein QLL95_gp0695 [Cotonvirus japonicus]|uniref:Transmembrane protein n=1 Tax=Cotonvirus japonicus TaxID=2811091 RepID=A0ABM7NTC3_9VIRU|nr:hypothetical protein QLL95_gp0695 [Cotonvirus japonicus]BCS83428.1 hypothetical protein [Cotonvirus japonicus]
MNNSETITGFIDEIVDKINTIDDNIENSLNNKYDNNANEISKDDPNENEDENKNEKLVEKFDNTTVRRGLGLTYLIIHMIAFIFAIYLAVKCNHGFSFWSLLVAFFCPWIYIIYILISRKGFCSDYVDGLPPVKI